MSDRRERLETERSVAEAEPKGTSYEVKDTSRDGSGVSVVSGSFVVTVLRPHSFTHHSLTSLHLPLSPPAGPGRRGVGGEVMSGMWVKETRVNRVNERRVNDHPAHPTLLPSFVSSLVPRSSLTPFVTRGERREHRVEKESDRSEVRHEQNRPWMSEACGSEWRTNRRAKEWIKGRLTVYWRIILWVQPPVKEGPTFPFLSCSWD